MQRIDGFLLDATPAQPVVATLNEEDLLHRVLAGLNPAARQDTLVLAAVPGIVQTCFGYAVERLEAAGPEAL